MKGIANLFTIVLILASPFLVAQETNLNADPYQQVIKGMELMKKGHYVAARKTFDDFLNNIRPYTYGDQYQWIEKAQLYRAISAAELLNPDARYLLADFIEEFPESNEISQAHYYLGRYFFTRRRYEDASEHFEKVNEKLLSAEQQTDFDFQRGYAYFIQKKFAQAQGLLVKAKNSEKYYFPAHYYHGFIKFEQQYYDQALADFQAVEDSKYYGQVVPFYIASIYLERGELDKVIDYCQEILTRERIKYEAEINQILGKAYYEQQEYALAKPYLEKYAREAAKLSKEDLFQLAFVQHQTGDYTNAIENFIELSTEEDTVGQNALYLLGDCYYNLKDFNKARSSFQQAARYPYDEFIRENALFSYGKLSYQLGFNDAAIATFRDFTRLYPESENVSRANELLTEVLLQTRNFEDALKILESIGNKTEKLKEGYQQVAYYRAVELINNNAVSEAIDLLDKALEYPLNKEIFLRSYFLKAEALATLGSYTASSELYQKFLDKLGDDPDPACSNITANYGLGYNFFKMYRYGSALRYFEAAARSMDQKETVRGYRGIISILRPDVTIRLGDCHFMLDQKELALAKYNEVIDQNYPNRDYAYFQKGMLHGLLDQPGEKIKAMATLVRNYPESVYTKNALFEEANTYFLNNEFANAIRAFEAIIEQDPDGKFAVQSLLKLAFIYDNNDQSTQAKEYFQELIRDFPGTDEAIIAQRRLKSISIETGRPEWYSKVVKTEISEQDSLLFLTAESFYTKGECDKSVEFLDQYLGEFTEGYFAVTAHFYRADCHFRWQDYPYSLRDYEYVIENSSHQDLLETAFLRAAKISHKINKNYERAFEYYQNLLPIATFKENKKEALDGLMRCGNQLKKYNQTRDYAKKLLQLDNLDPENEIEANYLIGWVFYHEKNYETAAEYFKKVSEQTQNERGVASRYYLNEIAYHRGDLDEAFEGSDYLIKNLPSYEYWLVKSYILIADIYTNKEQDHQARATLKSIVDFYEGDEALKAEAETKLKNLEARIQSNSKIQRGTGSTPLQEDIDGETPKQ